MSSKNNKLKIKPSYKVINDLISMYNTNYPYRLPVLFV